MTQDRAPRWPAWLNPAAVILGFTGVLSIITVSLSDSMFEEWGAPKYFDNPHAFLTWVGIAALLLGIMFGSSRSPRGAETDGYGNDEELIERWYKGTGGLVLLGYAAWILIALARGIDVSLFQAVLDRDLGAISSLKGYLAPVGGITTLTQLSGIVSAIGAHRFCRTRRVGRLWVFVVLAGVFRALFYAERLALMEVLIPAILIMVLELRFFGVHRRLTRWLPALGLVALVVVFSTSEYFRSWVFYSKVTDLPFVGWVLLRLVGYYATSFNNDALYYNLGSAVGHDPYYTFSFAYDFPGMSTVFGRPEVRGNDVSQWWMNELQMYANEEFNNTGSFLVPMADLGIAGGVVFWILVGAAIGKMYRRARSGSEVGVIAYSVLFLGLLELPRFTYWTLGRFFPVIVAVVLMIGYDQAVGRRNRTDVGKLGAGFQSSFLRRT
ncbi:MAG: O-antigen polymerase [Acidipropionibacterium acidipropionici]|jgi:oligosaccharide repeat unit polymerase|uniref:O-antigen polymerase n=1 Tax=Acidipropionibacterium acidipropionici TaxID=1748 RepID=UPI002F35A3D8